MDGIEALIAEARANELEVLAQAGKLVVRGPSAAEAIARELVANKEAVLTALAIEGNWQAWIEHRDGKDWHVIQRTGERVFPWCDHLPVPPGIHQRTPTQ